MNLTEPDAFKAKLDALRPLPLAALRNLHRLILKQINDDHADRYRQLNVTIAGTRHVPPDMLLGLEHWHIFGINPAIGVGLIRLSSPIEINIQIRMYH
jgi:hypothetical protein